MTLKRSALSAAGVLLAGTLAVAQDCAPGTPCWTTATRPASPRTGMFGFNTSINQFEWYNSLTGNAQLPALAFPGASDLSGTSPKWSSSNLVIGPMLSNPPLLGGPLGSSILSIWSGTLSVWN